MRCPDSPVIFHQFQLFYSATVDMSKWKSVLQNYSMQLRMYEVSHKPFTVLHSTKIATSVFEHKKKTHVLKSKTE